jgi:hypothetical protein
MQRIAEEHEGAKDQATAREVTPFTSEELRVARRESKHLHASAGGNYHKFSDLKTLIYGPLSVIIFLQFAKNAPFNVRGSNEPFITSTE